MTYKAYLLIFAIVYTIAGTACLVQAEREREHPEDSYNPSLWYLPALVCLLGSGAAFCMQFSRSLP